MAKVDVPPELPLLKKLILSWIFLTSYTNYTCWIELDIFFNFSSKLIFPWADFFLRPVLESSAPADSDQYVFMGEIRNTRWVH